MAVKTSINLNTWISNRYCIRRIIKNYIAAIPILVKYHFCTFASGITIAKSYNGSL